MAHNKKSAWVIKPWNFNSKRFHWPSLFNSSLEATSTLSLPFVFGVNLVLLAKSSLTKFWVLLESTKYQGCHVLVLSLKLHDVWCKSSTYCMKRNPRHHLFTSHLNFHIHLLIVFLGTCFNQEQPFALVAWVIIYSSWNIALSPLFPATWWESFALWAGWSCGRTSFFLSGVGCHDGLEILSLRHVSSLM